MDAVKNLQKCEGLKIGDKVELEYDNPYMRFAPKEGQIFHVGKGATAGHIKIKTPDGNLEWVQAGHVVRRNGKFY